MTEVYVCTLFLNKVSLFLNKVVFKSISLVDSSKTFKVIEMNFYVKDQSSIQLHILGLQHDYIRHESSFYLFFFGTSSSSS